MSPRRRRARSRCGPDRNARDMEVTMADSLPDIGAALAPVLANIPRQRQPLLIALAERQAAARYRAWAEEFAGAAHRADLLACAEREEEIARRVEAMYPGALEIQSEIATANPGL